MLCGEAVAAMWVFPQVLRILKLHIRHGQKNYNQVHNVNSNS